MERYTENWAEIAQFGLEVRHVDILIESTQSFEQDLDRLSQDQKSAIVQKINGCARLFPTQPAKVYGALRHLCLPLDLNSYESSLYVLQVSKTLSVILTVDEDPIFEQAIFTLFRVPQQDDLDTAYQDVAKFLYRELLYSDRETCSIS